VAVQRLRQLRKSLNLVSTGKLPGGMRQGVITSFYLGVVDKKDQKYLQRLKNTSEEVFSGDSGGAGFPSSDMLSQVPGTWSRLPRSSESEPSLIKSLKKSSDAKR